MDARLDRRRMLGLLGAGTALSVLPLGAATAGMDTAAMGPMMEEAKRRTAEGGRPTLTGNGAPGQTRTGTSFDNRF